MMGEELPLRRNRWKVLGLAFVMLCLPVLFSLTVFAAAAAMITSAKLSFGLGLPGSASGGGCAGVIFSVRASMTALFFACTAGLFGNGA